MVRGILSNNIQKLVTIEEVIMNKAELLTRLDILLEQEVIAKEAYDITVLAFEQLVETIQMNNLEQAEMLFTHLPSALTRMNTDEEVERPAQVIMEEIESSPHFPKAKAQVDFVEKKWGKEFPIGEREYLYMHYTTVIQMNQGGEE